MEGRVMVGTDFRNCDIVGLLNDACSCLEVDAMAYSKLATASNSSSSGFVEDSPALSS